LISSPLEHHSLTERINHTAFIRTTITELTSPNFIQLNNLTSNLDSVLQPSGLPTLLPINQLIDSGFQRSNQKRIEATDPMLSSILPKKLNRHRIRRRRIETVRPNLRQRNLLDWQRIDAKRYGSHDCLLRLKKRDAKTFRKDTFLDTTDPNSSISLGS
jgi:hypothetical protein